ncbi:hypothetical protein J3E68DRAFT_429415 [Trichoderma sp. SZMC 28012]
MDVDDVQNWGMTLNALFEKDTAAVGPDLNAAEGAPLSYRYPCSRSVLYNHASVVEWKYPLQILVEENVASSLFFYSPKLPPIESFYVSKEISLDEIIKELSGEEVRGGAMKGMISLGICQGMLQMRITRWMEFCGTRKVTVDVRW